MCEGIVWAVCLSKKKGTVKEDVGEATLIEGMGLEGDAHAGFMHRQVSLLALEDIEKMREKMPNLGPGSFAENITVKGLDMDSLSIGDRISVGETLLEVTQIGKECHSKCEIFKITGDCIMPKKGIFCAVIKGGRVKKGDVVKKVKK
ncbi:MOSC domain-containing protein [Acetomicrobium hydrogeniformans]|jgi:MOSC domain-containing protein YiiM|uniref:MOSC domain protein n=1 Tax=Acetomicrobium hydrogeniformans ATCC BAA-1850 TaxID=592015 RepID=A0A0T5X7Z4_9BACT|nr:MOSC domain-containing protein [Acetomicrobium hydrogeniformans]KRT34551.1 MOSC domain protein [Acetomicrobium hydrogeniformans ATCC BAA-1850]